MLRKVYEVFITGAFFNIENKKVDQIESKFKCNIVKYFGKYSVGVSNGRKCI